MQLLQVASLFCYGLVAARAHWEPCKIQCDKNFSRNEMNQPQPLVDVCQRGCDFFTVALISTAHGAPPELPNIPLQPIGPLRIFPISFDFHNQVPHVFHQAPFKREVTKTEADEVAHSLPSVQPKEWVRIIPSDHTHKFHSPKHSGEEKSFNTHSNDIKDSTSPTKKESRVSTEEKVEEVKKEVKIYRIEKEKPEEQSGKTTQDPISQPVQDRPSGAAEHTTTTNNPKKNRMEVFCIGCSMKANKLEDSVHRKAVSDQEKKIRDYMRLVIQRRNDGHDKSVETHEDIGNEKNISDRLEQAKHSCRRACLAAYKDATESEACVVGCNLQATTASLAPMGDQKKLSPLKLMENVAFNFAGQIGKLVSTTWSSWTSSFHGKQIDEKEKEPIEYGSEGLTRRAHLPLFTSLRPTNPEEFIPPQRQENEISRPKSFPQMINLITLRKILPQFSPETNMGSIFIHRMDITSIRERNSIKKESKETSKEGITIFGPGHNKHDHEHDHKLCNKPTSSRASHFFRALVLHQHHNKGVGATDLAKDQQLDLLECISRKSGLPRWFIALTIFASALVVLYLCFSLTAPPEDIRVVKTKPPEHDTIGLSDDADDDDLSCSEKKKLLQDENDLIKIRIENV